MISRRHLRNSAPAILAASVLLLTPFTARALNLLYIDIADTSTTIPGVGGTFTSFSSPEINGYTVAFQGNKSGYTGIFTGTGVALTGIVDTTTNVPNTLTPFTSFSGFSLDSNQVAFNGSSSGNQGIYLTTPTGLSKVVDLTTAIPNGTGSFASLSAPSLSQGNLAFIGSGASSQQGVYSNYNNLHMVANTTTPIPNGTGSFVAGSFALATQSYADTNFVGGGTAGQNGIYDNSYNGSKSEIANTTTAVPGGTGNFSSFGSVIHGSYGDFVWVAGSLPGTGIYTNSGGPVSVIANATTSIPGGTGSFASFGAASHSNSDVAFIGNGSGGQVGLYTNTGGSLVNVIAKGSVLNGKTVTGVSTSTTGSINNGNLVFNVTFSDGSSAIYAAEQNYGWAANTSGTWDNAANWSFGVKPGTALWTNINPDSGILLSGPTASTAILGLTIGANNGNGIAELRLQPGAQLTTLQNANISTWGQLTLNGSVFYANYGLNNAGVFNLSGGQVAGGGFYNQGTVEGSGMIGNYFENDNYGQNQPGQNNAGFVQSLNATVHFANGFNNYSEYQIINSQVQLDGNVQNQADQGNGPGIFDVRNSILQFTSGMSNHGQLNFTFGTSDVFGPVTIGDTSALASGQVIVSGNSNVTFYDRLIHNGDTFRVSPGSTAIFFGLVSGAGAFTGGGDKIFEGGYSPGNSPAAVSLDGPVTFDAANTLYIELGGSAQGSGYDHVQVNGQLSLDGALQVTLINGYLPNVGATFDVLDWTSVMGTFASTPSATQQGILKLFWNTVQNPTNINLTLTRAYYDIQGGTYTQPLTGVGYEVVKSTSATALVNSAANYSGLTTLSAGVLQFSGGVSHSIAGVSGTGSLAVVTGTTLTSDGVNLPTGSLIVAGAQTIRSSASNGAYQQFATGNAAATLSGSTKVTSLTVTGTLDIKNNALIVESTGATGNKSTLLVTIAGELGTAITSSTATTNSHYTMDLIDNGKLGASFFGGFPVDVNSILVTEALKGDANLDGNVTLADLTIWKANFGKANAYAANVGDFNHDGNVTLADLTLWKSNFGAGVGTYPAPSDASTGGLILPTATYGGGISAVPEPASLAVLALGAVGLVTRKRRRAQRGE